nr:DEAD/DEAH box helicase family protein [Pseudomarimonas arenosa]
MHFRHTWRPYQARVLQAFEQHLSDRHFHVVAAPGAGKTVLGLEALRRLGRPALVLAPSLAIRDQWCQRWRQDFVSAAADHPSEPVDSLSFEIDTPARLTFSTYQALHAASKRLGNAALIDRPQSAGIECLVFDEAHHLRSAWWRCLDALKQGLDQPWIIALTATPPFDVSAQEWNRYLGLCGPVDEEVSIPEQVRAGTLCPHQDFLHLCLADAEQQAHRREFDQRVRRWLTDWLLDSSLIAALRELPLVQTPASEPKQLLEQHDWLLALCIFLSSAAGELAQPLRAALRLSEVALPAFDLRWAELLVNALLFRPGVLDELHPWAQRWRRELKRGGAIERRRVYLRDPPRLSRRLETCSAKIDAIAEVLEFAQAEQGLGLRAAVLCDRIVESALPQPGEGPSRHRLGVVPVFEAVRQRRLADARLALLSGSLLILPTDLLPNLHAALPATLRAGLVLRPLDHDPVYTRIDPGNTSIAPLVAAVTQLFARGELNLLIGTAALLGEGWDAPALNTLIIASTAGASMSCNQMRGRSLRLDPQRPHKVAQIWHLACVEPQTDSSADAGGPDLASLRRRFATFAGLDASGKEICNGLARVVDPAQSMQAVALDEHNRQQRLRASDPQTIERSWQQALGDVARGNYQLRRERRIPARRLPPSTLLRWLSSSAPHWFSPWAGWLRRRRMQHLTDLLLTHLQRKGVLETNKRARVRVELLQHGFSCRLDQSSHVDAQRFDEALNELFGRPLVPRYLIEQQGDYFPLPKAISSRRADAEALARDWRRQLGPCRLLSTRSQDGRHALLAAKEAWLLSAAEVQTESRLRWSA